MSKFEVLPGVFPGVAAIRGCLGLSLLLAFLAGCGPRKSPASEEPNGRRGQRSAFTDITAAAGIGFTHRNGQGAGANIVETTGTGCGMFDADQDGDLDLLLVNGKSPPGDGNHLYRNDGDGRFVDVTDESGLRGPTGRIGLGCAVGDVDADGRLDVYITYFGGNALFRNAGGCRFEDVTARSGTGLAGFSTAATFADFDGDDRLDLYVARYCVFDRLAKQLCNNRGVPTSCPPYYYKPEPDVAMRNLGNNRFKDHTAAWGFREATGRGLGVTVVDYNQDNKLDLFVANDGSPNFLFRGTGKKYQNLAAEEAIGLSGSGSALANMGCDFGDLFNDGTFAAATGVFQNEVHPIWRYRKGIGFEEVSARCGIASASETYLTFGLGFADLNRDGWLDIVMANGHVQDRVEQIDKKCTYPQQRLYFQGKGGGEFEDRSQDLGPDFLKPAVGRGLAFGDIDNDGDVDLLVSNNNSAPQLLRNDLPNKPWIGVRLLSRGKVWEALTARVTLETSAGVQTRFVHPNHSFSSFSDHRLHFGLGEGATIKKLTVRWPDGSSTEHDDLSPDRYHTLVQPGATLPPALRDSVGR